MCDTHLAQSPRYGWPSTSPHLVPSSLSIQFSSSQQALTEQLVHTRLYESRVKTTRPCLCGCPSSGENTHSQDTPERVSVNWSGRHPQGHSQGPHPGPTPRPHSQAPHPGTHRRPGGWRYNPSQTGFCTFCSHLIPSPFSPSFWEGFALLGKLTVCTLRG